MSERVVTVPLPDGPTFRRGVLIALVIVAVLYMAYVVREIWLPIGLAFVIAVVVDPVVDKLQAKGWKRPVATALLFGVAAVIMGAVIAFATPRVVAQATDVQEQFAKFFPDTSEKGLTTSFTKLNVPHGIASVGVKAFQSGQQGLAKSSNYVTQYGIGILSNLIWVVIIPIVAFYAVVDFHTILGKLLLLIPGRSRNLAETYISEVSVVFAKYLRGLAILSVMNGVATALLLGVLQVPSALVVGIIAGILYSVPYVGAILTVAITASAAFVGGGVGMMAWAVGLSIILHQIIFDQMISPRLLGGTVGLHPILSIIALLSGNLLMGIIGMILAVPIAACIQILVVALVPKLRQDIESTNTLVPVNDGEEQAAGSRTIQAAEDAAGGTVEDSVRQASGSVAAEADLRSV